MYNSTKDSIPLMDQKASTSVVDLIPDEDFLNNPFAFDKGNNHFWDTVSDLYDNGKSISWDEALVTVQAKDFRQRASLDKHDPMVYLLEGIHDKFMSKVPEPRQSSGFIQQLTKLGAKILHLDHEDALKEDEDPKYSDLLPEKDDALLLLHLIAERDLVDLAEIYVEIYPGHVHMESDEDTPKLPIEHAIENFKDRTAAFLASKMARFRVRGLFESDGTFPAHFKFSDIIQHPEMGGTVNAVLEACINADWPYVPVNANENKEMAWSKLKDRPVSYHFHYNLLDSDQSSNPPKVKQGDKMVHNNKFIHQESSPLQLLINNNKHNKLAILHPTVRVLVDHKWHMFGRRRILEWLGVFLLYLLLLVFALFLSEDWGRSADLTIKMIVVVMTLGYMIEEIDQVIKEKRKYFSDKFNLFDVFGIVLVFALIPLRALDQHRAYYGVASPAFLFNCLRVFKFFPAFEQLGIYSKTFFKILFDDVMKFAKLFVVLMITFTGTLFLAMKAAKFPKAGMGFWTTLLKEARALAEGNPFEDDYEGEFSIVIIVLILLNMALIIVVLSNLLIGQMSNVYNEAVAVARVSYSIDKAKYVCKVEKSRFERGNLRIKHYIPGDFMTDEASIEELLSDWYKLKQKNETSQEAIKNLYEKLKK